MNRTEKILTMAAMTLAWVMPLPATAQTIIFVDDDAKGANDGTSWQNAYNDLQDAFDESCMAPGLVDIWVAEGLYKPDRGTGDRMMSFELHDGLALYGGFAGDEDPATFDLIDRDFAANETILSGDLLDNDDPDFVPESDCCLPWDGFQIGCDDKECLNAIVDPDPTGLCDGLWTDICVSIASQVCCDLCRPSRCDNSFHVMVGVSSGASFVLDGLTVQSGEGNGGDEVPFGGSGGGLYTEDVAITIANGLFRFNAGNAGAAVSAKQSSAIIVRSSFVGNESYGGLGQALQVTGFSATATLADSLFSNNDGQGAKLDTIDPTEVVRCVFEGNTGEGLLVSSSQTVAIVLDCEFIDNADHGVSISPGTTANITRSTFAGNVVFNGGAGMKNRQFAIVEDCLFEGNVSTSSLGGAIFNDLATLVVRGTTITGNHADGAGGIYAGLGSNNVSNSILWGNTTEAPDSDVQINPFGGGELSLSWSCVQDWQDDWGGTNVFTDDPLFIDELGPDGEPGTGDENYRLSANSPLINMGDPDFVPDDDQTDLDGFPRVLCGRVDIGAYEFGIGDYDCDRDVDLADFAGLPGCLTGPNGGPYADGCEAFDYVFQTNTGTTRAIDLRDVSCSLRALPAE